MVVSYDALLLLLMASIVNGLDDRCTLTPDSGPCLAISIRFFYNFKTLRCEAFQYGGCLGNRNNFASKADCQAACQDNNWIKEPPALPPTSTFRPDRASLNNNNLTAVCRLPKDSGQCFARIPAWYYDTNSNVCEPFYYTGCGGNKNLFATREECIARCGPWQQQQQPLPVVDPSNFPPIAPHQKCLGILYADMLARSPVPACRAQMPRFQYNQTSRQCERFVWGGCPPIDNMFANFEDCVSACGNFMSLQPPLLPTIFPLPPAGTKCVHFAEASTDCSSNWNAELYYFNATTRQCQRGCSSRNNRFSTLAECIDVCMPPSMPPPRSNQAPANCYLPPDSGTCFEKRTVNFFFHPGSGLCQPMSYGGCGGNANRFATKQECETTCARGVAVDPAPPSFQQPELCMAPPDAGPCRASVPMFYYNATAFQCQMFNYGGCDGNNNRFTTLFECEQKCQPGGNSWAPFLTSTTQLPPTTRGSSMTTLCPPDAPFARCNYDPCSNVTCPAYPSATCVPNLCYCTAEFFVSGLKVNSWCGTASSFFSTTQRPPTTVTPAINCQSPTRQCLANPCDVTRCPAFPYAQCQPDYCRCAASYIVAGRNVTEFCQQQTTITTPPMPSAAMCPPGVPRLTCENPCNYAKCTLFNDATCIPNYCGKCVADFYRIGFKIRECSDMAVVAPLPPQLQLTTITPPPYTRCNQPVQVGFCEDSISKYFYNASLGMCQWFSYSGCGGNDNNFESKNECENTCRGTLPLTTIPPPVCGFGQPAFDCPSNLCENATCPGYPGATCTINNCGKCSVDFYLQGSLIARCSSTSPMPSFFTTPTPSVWATSSWQSAARCNQPVAPGRCDQRIWMFFYNTTSARCEPFVYSGCSGSANMFSSLQDCDFVCNNATLSAVPSGDNACPPGVRPVQCLINPCDVARCPAYPEATCIPSNCGSCGRDFYVGRWKVADCYNRDQVAPTTEITQRSSQICFRPLVTGYRCSQPAGTMYFYNLTSSQCESYFYAGCGQGVNSFNTLDICNSFCLGQNNAGPTTPWYLREQTTTPWWWNTGSTSEGTMTTTGRSPAFDPIILANLPFNCSLPVDKGTCSSSIPAYFFNITSLQCEPFQYSGCGGNSNKYFTLQDCQAECTKLDPNLPLPSVKPCLSDIVVNCLVDPCFQATCAAYPMARCIPNMCGGCFADFYIGPVKVDCSNGPASNFNSSLWVPPPRTCPQEGSGCRFNPCQSAFCPAQPSARCIPNFCNQACTADFYDMNNRKVDCTGKNVVNEDSMISIGKRVVVSIPPLIGQIDNTSLCLMPVDAGRDCDPDFAPSSTNATLNTLLANDSAFLFVNRRRIYYHFELRSGQCRQFNFSGCGGNDNRFDTLEMCQMRCDPKFADWTMTTLIIPSSGSGETSIGVAETTEAAAETTLPPTTSNPTNDANNSTTNYPPAANLPSFCFLDADPGVCDGNEQYYYFDANIMDCRQFLWTGCAGNNNRFTTLEDCRRVCGTAEATTTPTTQNTTSDAPTTTLVAFARKSLCLAPTFGELVAQNESLLLCLQQPVERFQYNRQTERCEQFTFAACADVLRILVNFFDDLESCQQQCNAPTSGAAASATPSSQQNRKNSAPSCITTNNIISVGLIIAAALLTSMHANIISSSSSLSL